MRSEQHHFASRRVRCVIFALVAAFSTPAFAQSDVQAVVLKHLKTSREFTLKVADQMPESAYDFKLTPPQMSFAEQLVHLSQAFDEYLSPLLGQKPNPGKPASMSKKDVIAFVRKSFDGSIETVSKLTPAQLAKTYNSDEGTMSGLELVMAMLDHTTHHRASAEMYLRARGITPVEYQF
jgi:uncharacterized damage-inducible protein DinB